MTGLVEIRADIKDMTLTEKQDFTFKLVAEGQKATITTIQGYFRLGKVLDLLLGKDKLWKHYASHIESESQFVEDAFHIKLSMASHVRRVSKTFADRVGDRAIPFNRLLEALPIVNEENVDTIIEDAECLPRKDWENSIAEAKGKMPSDVCLHEKTEVWERCAVKGGCGRWLRKL